MKTAIIAGATGLTGQELTRLLIEDTRYSKLILLLRKQAEITHEKIEQVIFNFEQPNPSFPAADEIFCCLGTTIKNAGSKNAFYKVDHDFVSSIAIAGRKCGAKRFALISAMGANKNSAVFYNKVKGLAEETVAGTGYESCFIFRPSLLLGHRKEFRLGEKMANFFMTSFSFIIPKKYKPVEAKQVAKAMLVAMNSGKTGVQIFESDEIAIM
jgi:uncharacterized protein YbjT (DUF2867 family)